MRVVKRLAWSFMESVSLGTFRINTVLKCFVISR